MICRDLSRLVATKSKSLAPSNRPRLLHKMHGAQTSWWTFFAPGDGFSFDYAAIAPTPVPPTLLLFATGLGALGLLGWRRKKAAPLNA